MKEIKSVIDLYNFLHEALERVEAIEHKVKHGKYKIVKKKIKDQVLKDSEPRDIEREEICKNARKKAHTDLADTKQEISKERRERTHHCHEGLEIIDESATTISGMYGLDFMEESTGWGVDFTFFDKPQVTPLSESLDIGTTKTGRKRKCKALGIAEGVFAPIVNAEGDRVFSRNRRLYESDHWDYQLENVNFMNKVQSRRMLGMIGHEDKKITDADLRDGKVSHIVTDLEIREDEKHGRYLWGRLEVINTEAGRNLKEYYEQDIPLYVSSRGGGKLIAVPGQDYKKVDKSRYYCECFDVVREPGFLEAAPVYHSISEEERQENNKYADLISELAESLDIDEAKLLEVIEQVDNRTDGDKDMSLKEKCNITTDMNAGEVIAQLLKPISEKISQLSDKLDSLESEVSEATEEVKDAEAPDVKEEAPAEAVDESKCEEDKKECCGEKDCEHKEEKEDDKKEKCHEAKEEKKDEKECCGEKDCEHKEEKKEKCNEEAEISEADEVNKDASDKVTSADAAKAELNKKEQKEEAKARAEAKEEVKEKVNEAEEKSEEVEEVSLAGVQMEEIPAETTNEEWAKEDPKETAPAISDLPKPALPNGGGHKDLGEGAWAKEDPKETAPAKSAIAGGEDAKKEALEQKIEKEVHAAEAKDAAAINAGIEGGANVTAHESVEENSEEKSEAVSEAEEAQVAGSTSELTQQVTDYKALYEALKEEFDKCNQTIDELLESIEAFGERHKEVVQESLTNKYELDSVKEQLLEASKALNSYKLQEKFNVTVEQANELLSSKDYETVVEELKAAEAQKIEEEAQATAEAVSESLSEAIMQQAPVSRKRKASSAFPATISESKDEEVSESVETRKRRRAYSAF